MTTATFHHVILFRLREGITLDRVRAARETLAELVELLPGVLHLAVTDNQSARNAGFTMVLFAVFENRPAYEVCTRHPEWQRAFAEFIDPVVAERLVVEGEAC